MQTSGTPRENGQPESSGSARAASILAALILILALASCSGNTDGRQTAEDTSGGGTTQPHSPDETTAEETTSNREVSPPADISPEEVSYSDLVFMDEAAIRLQWEIEISGGASRSAEHRELRNLVREMIPLRESAIEDLRSIKEREYGLGELPAEISPDQFAPLGLTEPATLTGADPFDKAFIDALLPRHVAMIKLASEAAEQSENPDIRSVARRIVDEREHEVSELAALRAQWYPEEVG